MCLPSTETIVKEVKKAVKRTGAASVFVATDNDPLVAPLTKALSKSSKSSEPIVVLSSSSVASVDGIDNDLERPQLDLAVLGRLNHFVGNCVSSFSAFVQRERSVSGFPSSWFAFPPVNPKKRSKAQVSSAAHEEL
jgi:peptide-O-fucosyltransferase